MVNKKSIIALQKWIKKNGAWNKGTKGIIKPNSGSFKKGKFLAEKHPNWKGGKYKNNNKYVFIYSPNHPYKNKDGYILEHRLVMEKHLGRFLKSTEQCHHINNKPDDNRIQNLLLYKDNKTHLRLHYKNYKLTNNKWFKFCKICKHWFLVNKKYFYLGKGNCVSVLCKKCHNNYNAKPKQGKQLDLLSDKVSRRFEQCHGSFNFRGNYVLA